MQEEVLRLILDYSRQKKLADEDFVYKLVDILVRYLELSDYVKDVEFKTGKGKAYAGYAYKDKKIRIYTTGIDILFETNYNDSKNLNEIEKYIKLNLYLAEAIMHETEHAIQFKKNDNSLDKNEEHKLIALSMFPLRIKGDENELIRYDFISKNKINRIVNDFDFYYNNLYKYIPFERMAEITATHIGHVILKQIEREVPDLFYAHAAKCIDALSMGYRKDMKLDDCPTKRFLYKIGLKNEWKKFGFYDEDPIILCNNVKEKYDYYEIMKYGFPVSFGDQKVERKRLR